MRRACFWRWGIHERGVAAGSGGASVGASAGGAKTVDSRQSPRTMCAYEVHGAVLMAILEA